MGVKRTEGVGIEIKSFQSEKTLQTPSHAHDERISLLGSQFANLATETTTSLGLKKIVVNSEMPPHCEATPHEILSYLSLPASDPTPLHDWIKENRD